MYRCITLLTAVLLATSAFAATNVSISSEPYLTGGLFTAPVLPREGEEVTITLRATIAGALEAPLKAKATVFAPNGALITEESLTLQQSDGVAEASFKWSSPKNGLYRVHAVLDPDNAIDEKTDGVEPDEDTAEDDNETEITLPVINKGDNSVLHFPWYSEVPAARWATCVTSTKQDAHKRLTERGVLPLNWEYGGMSWSYYNKERAKTDPEAELADLEKLFDGKFTSEAEVYGFGIDEIGGYPGSWKYKASLASMKALTRAKQAKPDRFFAVWNGGGLRPELAAECRKGADLLLLETYLWRAIPDHLGGIDLYETLVSRVEPYVRATDMFQPAYGNHCYTLLALDTSERPDRTDLGEQEQVIRFIRRRFPEMRGIAWYNGGYGNKSYGLVRSEATDAHHQAVLANADRLCFDYWVKPCITLQRESLWLTGQGEDATLTLAVNNIGAMDSGPVTVQFLVDGSPVGRQRANEVPAGSGRNANMVTLRQRIDLEPGSHRFEARIVSAPGATVLDCTATEDRFVQE